MLIARSPMRISFGGGGTDLEAYYAKYGGLVISTAINKYFYAVITTDESDDLQVISADYRSLFRHSPYNDLFWNGDLALPKDYSASFWYSSRSQSLCSQRSATWNGLGIIQRSRGNHGAGSLDTGRAAYDQAADSRAGFVY